MLLLLLGVNEETATDFEGARHMEDVRGEENIVNVGNVEIEVAGVHEGEEAGEFVYVDVGDCYGGGTCKIKHK